MPAGRRQVNRRKGITKVVEDDLVALVMHRASRFGDTFSAHLRSILVRSKEEAVADLEEHLGISEELKAHRFEGETLGQVVARLTMDRKFMLNEFQKYKELYEKEQASTQDLITKIEFRAQKPGIPFLSIVPYSLPKVIGVLRKKQQLQQVGIKP